MFQWFLNNNQLRNMKFFITILFLFFFEFASAQIPGTIGFIHKNPIAQSFTLSVSALDFTRANVTARILNNGIKPVTTSGIIWGFSVPTISSYTGITTNGDISGNNYTHQMTGLTMGGTYYVVAYATNEAGTSYGEVITYSHGTVYNATTGKTWLAVNLGATAFPTSASDVAGYGDIYQWGRLKDGHESRSSGSTSSTNNNIVPNNGGLFITQTYWMNNNSLWQGVNGINNPCPSGFRLPTIQEFSDEIATWNVADGTYGAFSSVLKLTWAGRRHNGTNNPWQHTGVIGYYWTSSLAGVWAANIKIYNNKIMEVSNSYNGEAYSVRCIKN